MAKNTLNWLLFVLAIQFYEVVNGRALEYNGLCVNMNCNSFAALRRLENCTVVIGDLKIVLLERAKPKDFAEMSFPKLKEVTGFIVFYRISGLESIGALFPNLVRIRGTTLLYNYALIVFDMPHLREIGFYNLLKIDRGGVIVLGGPLTCFVDTIDWSVIAPHSRHVLSAPDQHAPCNVPCTCSTNATTNRCWNNRKCQRFLEGVDSEKCSSECLGCRKTNPSSCAICRQFTYRGGCVPHCPADTLVLSVSNYCLTRKECEAVNRWEWRGMCVSECPDDHKPITLLGNTTCVPCHNCHKTCGNLILDTLATIQQAGKCVYVNGSLTIRVRYISNVANELRFYLKNIIEVSDYIAIYGSINLASLDFLTSLRRIRGRRLHKGKYSLVVYNMANLQTLFVSNVTRNLKVDRGTLQLYQNPMLCMNQVEKLMPLFPVSPNELDIPQGLNGYSGTCKEVHLGLKVRVKNITSATVTFYPIPNNNAHYTILYVRLPYGSNVSVVPETCSDFEWHDFHVPSNLNSVIEVDLLHLQPASTYAACIEYYEPSSRHLARSYIVNFTTPVGKPEPPFILELTALSANDIMIKWVNHIVYSQHITRYELDIYLLDIIDVNIINQGSCLIADYNLLEIDYSRHAKVMRPPAFYETACESMCGILSYVTVGAMVEDYFDVCSVINNCEHENIKARPRNITQDGAIKTMSLDLMGSKTNATISRLSPFRDYRFELRACTNDHCSRTVRDTVRTLKSKSADTATMSHASANSSGHISVQWRPPVSTNGPILYYYLEIYPNIKLNELSRTLPQVWCVSRNRTDAVVKSSVTNTYLVRICLMTFGSSYRCTDLKRVDVSDVAEHTWWLSSLYVSFILYGLSLLVGWKYRHGEARSDDIPLVDATSANRDESDPPAVMLSDFVPLYSFQYSDTRLE